MSNGHEFDQPNRYEIRVKGALDLSWSEWFDGFSITSQKGETVLIGSAMDQAALHGILAKINDLGLTLISVNVLYDDENKSAEALVGCS